MMNAEQFRTLAGMTCGRGKAGRRRRPLPLDLAQVVQLPTGLLRLSPQYTTSAPHTLPGRAASCAGSVEKTELAF